MNTQLGPPKTEPLFLRNGTPAPGFAPSYVVDAINYPLLDLGLLSGNVVITDFGEAFFEDSVPEDLGTPASYVGPEILFGFPPSYTVDLWALGCLLFNMHTSRLFVSTMFLPFEEAVEGAVRAIGALPREWIDSYYNKEVSMRTESGEEMHWFDEIVERTRDLKSLLLEHMPELSEAEHDTFLGLLKSVLIFEPAKRLSAADVAVHPWFTGER